MAKRILIFAGVEKLQVTDKSGKVIKTKWNRKYWDKANGRLTVLPSPHHQKRVDA